MQKIALDSYLFIDIFLRSEKEEIAKKYLEKAMHAKQTIVSSTVFAEVKYQIIKKISHEKAEEAVFAIKNIPNINIADVSSEIAELAADIRAKYYKKNDKDLSYADAIHLATAIENHCDVIITGDPAFEKIEEMKAEIY